MKLASELPLSVGSPAVRCFPLLSNSVICQQVEFANTQLHSVRPCKVEAGTPRDLPAGHLEDAISNTPDTYAAHLSGNNTLVT